MKLKLECHDQPDRTVHIGPMSATPPITEDYWEYRVRLSEMQAIVGFPKFGTIGIGFAKETDWNTNLPFNMPAGDIFRHIKHNKGSAEIKVADCLTAIEMIRSAAKKDHPEMVRS